MKQLIALSILFNLFISSSYAQEKNGQQTGEHTVITQLQQANTTLKSDNLQLLLDEEQDFNLVLSKQGEHNKKPITLYRFEPANEGHLGQQNVSFLINNETNKLQGFVRLRPQYSFTKQQVSKEVATRITTDFLKKHAPDLLVNSETNWIDTHDETIILNNKKQKLTGMKVKCRDLNTGLYFWTIVAPDSSIMVFERDIEWDFIKAGRQTEKWLHDSWLSKHKQQVK